MTRIEIEKNIRIKYVMIIIQLAINNNDYATIIYQ